MKNIVLCCDGTGNEYGTNNTNVVETYALVEKNQDQVAYYDPGVGTGGWEYDNAVLRAKNDQMTGSGLQRNVEDAYRCLMQCYQTGDRVYLFGFSRGAFTVRSLAGMLHKCGLLREGHENLVEYASKIYNTRNNGKIAQGFKSTFARKCPIKLIGVWDTVESLVLNAGKKWHNHSLNPEVQYGYHALSIDEQRRDFDPCLWNKVAKGQTIEQVWFAGVHSDVGGGYKQRGLSNITLNWMLKKASNCGLKVKLKNVKSQHPPNPCDTLHKSYDTIWRLRPKGPREIPNGALIHQTVFDRQNKCKVRYSPKNLPAAYKVVR